MKAKVITKLSICIAVFNGEDFLDYQLNSIINNGIENILLEIIIVDDKSTDNSQKICDYYKHKYKNINFKFIHNNRNIGHVSVFEKALFASSSNFIMLSDQDDFWPKGRIKAMLNILKRKKNIDLLIGNFKGLSSNELKFYKDEFQIKCIKEKLKFLKLNDFILRKYPFYGCCMAFRTELLDKVLPFPKWLDAHDRWIAAYSIINKNAYFLDQIVTVRGLHAKNKTSNIRGISQRLKSFCKKLFMIIIIFYKNFSIWNSAFLKFQLPKK